METLYDYSKRIYEMLGDDSSLSFEARKIINNTSFSEMISDDGKCIDFIRKVLDFRSPVNNNKNRASHIMVTWLLGVGFGKHMHINTFPGAIGNRYAAQIWLQTAMLHDYGYFCKELSKKKLSRKELVGKYDLLEDEYEDPNLKCLNGIRFSADLGTYFSYSPEEIEQYFDYSVDFHKDEEERVGIERADHGIIGGCVGFKKYCDKFRHDSKNSISDDISKIQKIACYTTASHNIFKSQSADDDEKYIEFGLTGLLSSSPIRVTVSNLLLLLLSLVDTIECTKRFSARENGKKNYLKQTTTLRYVSVGFIENGIQADFSELFRYIQKNKKNEKMEQSVINHVNALEGLTSWTDFHTSRDDSYKVTITI